MQKALKEEAKSLEKILSKNPNSILFAHLSDVYLQMGRFDEAMELCKRGVRIHPGYITGYFVLGKCYKMKKLFDQAERQFKRVIQLDPEYLSAYREYGELMANSGWIAKCERSFNHILRIDPLNSRAKVRLTELKRQNQLEQGEKTPFGGDFSIRESKDTMFPENLVHEIGKDQDTDERPELDELDDRYINGMEEDFLGEDVEDKDENMELLEDIFGDDSIDDLEKGTGELSPEDEGAAQDQPEELIKDKSIFEEALADTQETQLEDEEESQSGVDEKEEVNDTEVNDVFNINPATEKDVIDTIPPEEFQEPPEQTEQEPIQAQDEEKKQKKEDNSKEKEKIVTPTLGEIYAAQNQYSKAIGVYELLLKKDPDNKVFKQKIELLRKKLEDDDQENS